MTLKDLPKKWRKQIEIASGVVAKPSALHTMDKLRYEVRVAYLDGRVEQARKFNGYVVCI